MAKRSTKKKTAENDFVKALRFAALAQKDDGNSYEKHCRIENGWIIAFNGIVATGCRIDFDGTVLPNTKQFLASVEGSEAPSLVQLDSYRLAVKAGRLKAIIPCLGPADMSPVFPDAPCGELNKSFIETLEKVGVIVAESAPEVIGAAIFCRSQSCIATNRHVILEGWHGIDMPPIVIPKSFAVTLSKIDKEPIKFGFSRSSFTVYFKDESWIRTQLYDTVWPKFDTILNSIDMSIMSETPKDFFAGVNALLPYCEDKSLYLDNGEMRTHETRDKGAQYKVDGLVSSTIIDPAYLKKSEPFMRRADFAGDGNLITFFGSNVRGVIARKNAKR